MQWVFRGVLFPAFSMSYCGNGNACLWQYWRMLTFPLTVFKSNKSLGTIYTSCLVYYGLWLTGDDESISICFHVAEGKFLPAAAAPFQIIFLWDVFCDTSPGWIYNLMSTGSIFWSVPSSGWWCPTVLSQGARRGLMGTPWILSMIWETFPETWQGFILKTWRRPS